MLAVIGGSGLNQLDNFQLTTETQAETPYGPAVVIREGQLGRQEKPLLFMPRHGVGHTLPPHLINYRANLWALKNAGADKIIGVNAVGGIRDDMAPGCIVLPDQILDYTYGREHSFFTGDEAGVEHIDFTQPYTESLRRQVITCAANKGLPLVANGTYACTQGPRLETAAEIEKLRRDGADLVGMTGMPEASLARELGLPYCAINLVVNWGAGLSDEAITMEKINRVLDDGMIKVITLIEAILA